MEIALFFVQKLMKCGLSQDMAIKVIDDVVAEEELMRGRWCESIDDYPPIIQSLIWSTVEKKTLEHIKRDCPNAWFRGVFDMEHPLRIEFEAKKKAGEI